MPQQPPLFDVVSRAVAGAADHIRSSVWSAVGPAATERVCVITEVSVAASDAMQAICKVAPDTIRLPACQRLV
jgi:hypothetical protein